MAEFKKRVESDMNRFGDRAKEAERNLGLDYKALSHALRALMQMEELLLTGRIRFPLKEREELIAVKMGNFAWADLENRIVTMMKKVEDLQEKAPYVGVPDAEFAKSCVLSCYGLPAFGLSNFTPSERKYDSRFDAGFDIPPNTLTAIYEKLRTSEQTNGVRILYCCESGSRGWNFASRDSDFDVRFIYAHSRDWYLSVAIEDKPDVLDLGIEKTADGELDINGWELRKTLKLLRKSNGSFLEWLSSPIIYRAASSFLEAMRAFAADCFNPLAVWHHYRGMMERSTVRFEETPSIKAFFYILRPLLCMKWIENGLGLPPMRFDRVMDMVVTETPAKREILRLVNLKKSCGESGILHLSPTLLEYIDVTRAESNPPRIPEKRTTQLDIDVFFRKIVDST
ncbi:MAG: nucleotidyltransferase domain-containing protein [Synergistaceae bacterium]|nr:nucleotidyltransferase domain-containing protein [Synergistaceae bacterium]